MSDPNWMSSGHAAVWVRNVADDAMATALKFESAANAVPVHRGVAGYRGYLTAHAADAPQLFVVTLYDTADQVAEDVVAIQAFGAAVDPRIGVAPVRAETGRVRFAHWTPRPAEEIAPRFGGCVVTMRFRQNALDFDADAYAAELETGLSPMLQALEGFVAYLWVDIPDGRVGINIWDTTEQLEAGDAVVAEWASTYGATTSIGEADVYLGTMVYAELV